MKHLFALFLICLIFSRAAADSQCEAVKSPTGFSSCSGLNTGDKEEKTCCYEEYGDGTTGCDGYSDKEISNLQAAISDYNSEQKLKDEKVAKVDCGTESYTAGNCTLVASPSSAAACTMIEGTTDEPNCCFEKSTEVKNGYCEIYKDDEMTKLEDYVTNYNYEDSDDKITYVYCGENYKYTASECSTVSDPSSGNSCNGKDTADTDYPNCCYETADSNTDGYCELYSDSEMDDLKTYVNDYNENNPDDKIIKVDCGNGKKYGSGSYLNSKVFALIALVFALF